ncbi:MAG: hypothetical protein IKC70_05015 [Bacteroidaceae bacterium]|nr:hypothetical protein [Bacteroidaceae bacterium]
MMLQDACSNDNKRSIESPNYSTFDPPKWNVENSTAYEHSASAIVIYILSLEKMTTNVNWD